MSVELTKKQIDFLEDYLIKNKVKYWDVRIELLDHVATEVENRMHHGQTFDRALEEVHVAFGNKLRSKKLSKDQTQWIFTESIYADSSGYKKLIMDKQRELNRGFRKKLWQEIMNLIKHPLFIVVYFAVMASLYFIIQNGATEQTVKLAIFLPIILSGLMPMGYTLWFWSKKKRSLNIDVLSTLPLFGLTLFQLVEYIPEAFGFNLVSIWIYFFMTMVCLRLDMAIIVLTHKYTKKYQQFYLKWNKAS
ncbi:hypothetical protein [Maribacter sp. 2304DJ31-5]|uniref:hypothetical protein n=1 Tax=Maribacter sp. 2304DJ31-5 TaxID=3386273 RepID=UPI0039BC2786